MVDKNIVFIVVNLTNPLPQRLDELDQQVDQIWTERVRSGGNSNADAARAHAYDLACQVSAHLSQMFDHLEKVVQQLNVRQKQAFSNETVIISSIFPLAFFDWGN
jgi:hypothetical protein